MQRSASLLASSLRWTGVGAVAGTTGSGGALGKSQNSAKINFNTKFNPLVVRTRAAAAGSKSAGVRDSPNTLVDSKLRTSTDTNPWWAYRAADTSKSNTAGKSLLWLSPGAQATTTGTGTTLFTRSFASVTSTAAAGPTVSPPITPRNPTTTTTTIIPSPTTKTTTRNMSSTTSADKLKILIFYGSTRQGRFVERVGEFVKSTVEENGMEPIIMDPAKLPFEVLKCPLHFYPNPADAPAWLHDENAKIKSADGFIFLSAEYNCGIPPALANMIDHFPPPSFRHKPLGLVTYSMGQFGGVRAQVVLRPFSSELGMVSIPAIVAIPTVQNAFDETGKCLEERIAKNTVKLVQELAWYAAGLKNQRAVQAPPS